MDNPHAIHIHCDGAMSYDSKQTGGNGFIIEFPDFLEIAPIKGFFRNDQQGIQRLEMISILEALDKLLAFGKQNPGVLRRVTGGVIIYTDRISVTDENLLNPYRIQNYRKNGWHTHEGKPVKDIDLLDRIDKTRKKLCSEVGGRVEVKYKKEKYNKVADKLSRAGRESNLQSKMVIAKKQRNVSPRKLDGPAVDYTKMQQGDILLVHVYARELVKDQYEVDAEIIDGKYTGRKIKIYVDSIVKANIHRRHCYEVEIESAHTHHISIARLEEFAP